MGVAVGNGVGRGVDVAFEVCGAAQAVPEGVQALRIGGRYLIAGLVTPGSNLGVEANHLTRKCLTIKGIHNYRPAHLERALAFLSAQWQTLPFRSLVREVYPLNQVNQAIQAALSGEAIRVALRPGPDG